MYTVTFIANGGKLASGETKEEVTVAAGAKVLQPLNPTREGHDFVEWQRDGKAYDFSAPVEAGFELVAQWKAKGETAVESELLATVQIYPNPVSASLVVLAESVIARYELLTIRGAQVQWGVPSELELRLDASRLPDGLYILRLVDAEGGVITRRIVVKK